MAGTRRERERQADEEKLADTHRARFSVYLQNNFICLDSLSEAQQARDACLLVKIPKISEQEKFRNAVIGI